MNLLALDTSNKPLSVALLEDDQLLATTTLNLVKNHSAYLLPIIENLMTTVHWQPTDLDRVVVAQGPGSYTGIRIAVTTAKTLAVTLGIELVGVSSLAVLAGGVSHYFTGLIVPIMNARRNNVFAGIYQYHDGKLIAVDADRHQKFSELIDQLGRFNEKVLFVGGDVADFPIGNLATFDYELADPLINEPHSYALGLLGRDRQPIDNVDGFVPTYLRLTEAETNWQSTHPGETRQDYVREISKFNS